MATQRCMEAALFVFLDADEFHSIAQDCWHISTHKSIKHVSQTPTDKMVQVVEETLCD